MAAVAPRQTDEKFRINKAHVFVRRKVKPGQSPLKWRDVGNCPSVTYTSELTRASFPSYQDSLNTPAYEPPTARTATVAFETQSIDIFVTELRNGAIGEKLGQTAQTALTYDVPGPIEIDDVIYLEKFAVDVTSFVSGAATFVKGEHFFTDSTAGIVIVVALPVAYAGVADGEITFDCAEYDEINMEGLSGGNDTDVEIMVRGTNEKGLKELVRFHFGKLSQDGERGFTADADLDSATFTVPLSPDPTKPAPGYFTTTILKDAVGV